MEAPFALPDGLALETDVEAASWIDEALVSWSSSRDGVAVGEIVPSGFEAYARILHPATRWTADGEEPVTWAGLARSHGTRVHPEVQLSGLLGDDFRDAPPWGELPNAGSLPGELRGPLVRTLRPFTGRPDRCWLCVWEGYGYWGGGVSLDGLEGESWAARRLRERDARRRADSIRRRLEAIPTVDMMRAGPDRIPQRRYFLFRGELDAVIDLAFDGWSQSPNYWWPEDREWVVVSEIDAPCTYVGGPHRLVEALLDEPALEVVTSALDHRFDWLGDRINTPESAH